MRRPALVLLGFLLFAVTASKAQTPGAPSRAATGAPNSSVAPKPIHLPLFFEANQGQTDSRVQFLSRSKGYTLLLTPTETVLAESKTQVAERPGASRPFQKPVPAPTRSSGSVIRMQLVGANQAPAMTGLDELPGKVNYLIGSDSSRWQTNVPLYSKVRTAEVYPGVDLTFHGDERQLEYDFIVAPRADPSKIAFRIRGASRTEIDARGDLVLHAADSDFVMHKPVIYQTIASERRPVEGGFIRRGKDQVAFQLGPYDRTQPLIIDPKIGFATFIGGNGIEEVFTVQVDDSVPSSPKIYVGGWTSDATTFGGTNPLPFKTIGPGPFTRQTVIAVGFLAKIDPTATGAASLIYLTFVGGKTPFVAADKECETLFGWLSLDKSQGPGNIQPVVGGETTCEDYPFTVTLNPVTAPSTHDIGSIATRFTSDGSAIDVSALLGGNLEVTVPFTSVNAAGDILITGETNDTAGLPVVNPYIATKNNTENGGAAGFSDCYLARLERADMKITYATYLNVGEGSTDTSNVGCGAFLDAQGNILAGGNTDNGFVFDVGAGGANLANGFQTTFCPSGGTTCPGTTSAVIAMKLDPTKPSGSGQLVYGTYYSGGGDTLAHNGSFDLGNGIVAIVGSTTSSATVGTPTFPAIPLANAFQSTNKAPSGGQTGFLEMIDTTKTGMASLHCSTFLGGSGGNDQLRAVASDAGDPTSFRIVLGGQTNSTDFPTMNPLQTFQGGAGAVDGFVTVLKVPQPGQTPFNASLYLSTPLGTGASSTAGGQAFDNERVEGLAVDSNHTIYATGNALSSSFFTPSGTTPNGFQTSCVSCIQTPPAPVLDDGAIFSIGTGGNATINSITVSPSTATIAAGQTQQFRALAFFSDGTIGDITNTATWASSNPATATVSNAAGSQGLATGVAGSASPVTITATSGTLSGQSSLTVTGGTPITLQVKTAGTAFGTVTDNLGQINCTQAGGANPSGNCMTQYPSGTQVMLTATTPGTGAFVGAPTACMGTGNTCQFTITATETVTATFTPGPGMFPLTVAAGTPHTGGGTITSSPTGINCTLTGATTSGTCTQNFPAGTLVTLTSAPGPGSNFFGWTGTTPNCLASSSVSCLLDMSAATTATVEFTSGGGTVNVTVTGAGNVTDTANAGEVNCTNTAGGTQTGTCSAGYTLGAGVTLTETPAAGATFSGWTGASCANPTAATCSFQVTNTTPIAVGATFTTVGPAAMLAVSKTHMGNFTQGQHSAQYTVTVSNAANGAATSGTVTVTDTALSALAQDFAASFSGTSNPNGVWSYGQFVESTSTFTLFPGQNANPPAPCGLPYWSGTGYPYVVANNSGSTVSCGTVTIPNDMLWMHPMNMAGTDSDVRFTAPASGTYEITGSFSALDTTTTLDSILVNGTPVFSTFICNPGNGETCGPTNTRAPFSVVKTLSAGNTVDFIVNCCSGPDQTFLFDSTGLSGAIDSNLTGLSLVSMFGTGWTCGAPNPANTCTRNDALAPGASYPPITVLVNVGVNASSPQVNTVSVSGGGSATANASDSTVITPAPTAQLTITKTHTGNFTQGQQGAQYSLTVANSPGAGPTSGSQTQSTTVQSTGSIYDTGGGSTPPTMITLPSGATSVVFNSVTGSITTGCASTEGCIILNHGTGDNPNDPDGVGAVPATSSNTGTSSISGMIAPGAGYLVGVFVPAGGPAGAAPTTLDFTSSGLGTTFTSLSPQLDQVFFIGDGLTGNGTGTQQTFNIPIGAGQLWLGISDAPGYNGAPGAYGDNLGTYTVGFTLNAPGSGRVTVTETAPDGLTVVSMAGTGWTCGTPNAANVCTRSDTLAGGASYPVITVNVNVAANATSPQVNTASVTGGGSAPANASDSTVIVSGSTAATHFSVTAPATATPGTPINFTVTALDASNATATGYAGTEHFTSSDTAAALPANSTLTNGVGTFSATLNTAGNQTIAATDTVTASITGMSGAINVTTAATVQLTVQTAGTGTGTVTGNGIDCVSGSANGCIVSLPAGTQVVLTQAGTNGSTFAGWNGAPTSCTVAGATCTFTMPALAETVTATFTAAAATLKSIAVTPANPTEPINSSVQFTATGTFSDNSKKDITATVAWASSNTEAATINAAGLATIGGTAGLTTTISATLNEVTGSTLLTVSSSPISISVTPPAGGAFPPVPPGGTLAIGIVLTSTPGFSGTVTFGCTTSSPTITCAPDPATVTLTPTGPTDVAIVLNTFCKGVTTGSVPIPGGFGGGTTLLLLALTLGGVLWMWRRSPRWAVSFAILVLMAIGVASCASPSKGPNGATQPGNYTVTFSATVNGVTTSTAPIPFTVQ